MKKKVIGVSLVILLILSTIFISVIGYKKSFNKISAENLRAMSYTEVPEDGAKTQSENVEFSAFFTRDLNGNGYASKLLGTCKNIEDTDTLYMDLNVLAEGYLKDGKIKIESSNFNYSMNMVKDSVLKYNYISDDVTEICLNDVNAGTQKLILGNILCDVENNINNYTGQTTITLTGTHVGEDGITETPIEKKITLTVDWYGEIVSNINAQSIYYNYDNLENEEVEFNFYTYDSKKELILKDNIVNVQIPQLNGYNPTKVECTTGNVETNYDDSTRNLTLTKHSTLDVDGKVKDNLPYKNMYSVKIAYPKEAFDEISSYSTVIIPVESYYTGYNNTNTEFQNPYISNTASKNINIIFRETPTGSIYNFYVDFENKEYVQLPLKGYAISKQNVIDFYNGKGDKNETYIVKWTATRGPDGAVPSMVMSETKDSENYGDSWNDSVIADYVYNKGVYFSNAKNFLEENGTISIYNDDTNALIKTFTVDECNTYSSSNPYIYGEKIKHIRVETSTANANSALCVYNIKEIDLEKVKNNFTLDDIENVEKFNSTITGICNIKGQEAGTTKDVDYVYYLSNKSRVSISLSKDKLTTQDTIEHQKIYIKTENTQLGDSNWKNGEFLVELPKEIINMEINDVTVNDANVKISAYDLSIIDGKYFIKILTESEEVSYYTISVDCNMTPDPRNASATTKVKLYAYNEICDDYYQKDRDIYDVNGNDDIQENIGIASTNMEILLPTSVITLETVSDYNNNGDITIAPNVAKVETDAREATINVNITNNYSNTISGVQILGRIPFKDNKYILTEKSLGSEFTTTMTADGIVVPEELKQYVTVYYSENESADKNINNLDNGWKTFKDVTNFSNIKSYLIDMKGYTVGVGDSYIFTYKVSIPENITYNYASYSTHAVYYELNTDGGSLILSTEPNRVGLRIVRKYNLEILKYKSGTTLVVPGCTYQLVEKDENEIELSSSLITTKQDGTLKGKELLINRIYELKEIKSSQNYSLNDDTIKFKVTEDETGKLKITILSEDTFATSPIIETLGDTDTLKATVEDEPRYNLNITKVDNLTGETLENVTFTLKQNNNIFTTDANGKCNIPRLEKNVTYTLSEKIADGYYLLDDIEFKLIEDNTGNLNFECSNSNVKNITIDEKEQEDLINVNISILNEKIPTYNLQVLKVEENSSEEDINNLKTLSKAKFRITGQDNSFVKEYLTDENGYIYINDLYQYVDGKYITGKYVLQEIEAPDGYANNAEEIEFNTSVNLAGNLEVTITNRDNLKTVRDVQTTANTVKLIIQDKPLFKLIKTDKETNEPLANAEFMIYEVDDLGHEIDFAKDVNGKYVGNVNEYGEYIVTTDLNGTIILPLRDGTYKAIETGYPEGYIETLSEEYFKVSSNKNSSSGSEDTDSEEGITQEIEINYIEDLVDLANTVNSGTSYNGTLVKLARTLDFNEDNSYKNPNDTSYGDLNGDETVEGIKAELTNKAGVGFTPIGNTYSTPFSGIFDGQKNEIRNIYINTPKDSNAKALFGYIKSSKIKNLGVTGEIEASLNYVGGIVGNSSNENLIINCYNKVNIKNSSKAGGIIGRAYDGITIKKCSNYASIDSGTSEVGGIVGQVNNYAIIDECCNYGNLTLRASGIVGEIYVSR